MLDALNERPIYKKTITARPLIESLERAYRTRISRNQQDAQEFFQVVAERLCDEYHAGVKARQRAGINPTTPAYISLPGVISPNGSGTPQIEVQMDTDAESAHSDGSPLNEPEYGFPFEGQLESQIECQFCGFQYKPTKTSFVSLTLNVPQKSSATLSSCFDGLLKTEHIDDFKCDRCRVQYALDCKRRLLEKKGQTEAGLLEKEIKILEDMLDNDPEGEPKGVEMPPSKEAPKRKIAKHMRITLFPKLIAVHLSRSIFDPGSYSMKNAAKVSFPERLRLGGLLEERWYKLLGIVCHKGSHNSGHYESFRRQHMYPPYSTPDAFRAYADSRSPSPMPSSQPSPRLNALSGAGDSPAKFTSSPRIPEVLTPSTSTTSLSTPPSRSSMTSQSTTKIDSPGTPAPRASLQVDDAIGPRKSTQSDRSTLRSIMSRSPAPSDATKFRRKKKAPERWWRISDDKVKECKTSDVLGMQKEVYLLFYELEKPGET